MRYKPYLEANLDLGFMSLHTEVMHYNFPRDQFNYIVLYWSFFKWRGQFRLYKPGEHIRKEKKK
jgi:hypothetical protein